MRILFVENHSVFAETVITEFLDGYGVTLVGTCAEAQAAEVKSFDAVLVDYDLDDGKGDAVVRRLRESGFQGPIIAVSSHDDGNAALLTAGASVACKKSRFREVPALLQQRLADLGNRQAVRDRPALHAGAVVTGTVSKKALLTTPLPRFARSGANRRTPIRWPDERSAARYPSMLSAHGWVVVRSSRAAHKGVDTAGCDDLDATGAAADERLFAALEAFLTPSELPDLDWSFRRQMNNERGILMLSSSRNHRGARPMVLRVLDWLAEHGPGSYGLIYLHDDQDGRTGPASSGEDTIDFSEHYRVWRLRDGKIDELADPFLSPRDRF
jgi:CheY-like chemotaxis protein